LPLLDPQCVKVRFGVNLLDVSRFGNLQDAITNHLFAVLDPEIVPASLRNARDVANRKVDLVGTLAK
jgi:hypothetical protein